jgi:DNA-binding winged helix-turn-helix (wHTH) protein
MLEALLAAGAEPVAKRELLRVVWGPGYVDADGLLHDAMSRLRGKLIEAGYNESVVENYHGYGYRLRLEAA